MSFVQFDEERILMRNICFLFDSNFFCVFLCFHILIKLIIFFISILNHLCHMKGVETLSSFLFLFYLFYFI